MWFSGCPGVGTIHHRGLLASGWATVRCCKVASRERARSVVGDVSSVEPGAVVRVTHVRYTGSALRVGSDTPVGQVAQFMGGVVLGKDVFLPTEVEDVFRRLPVRHGMVLVAPAQGGPFVVGQGMESEWLVLEDGPVDMARIVDDTLRDALEEALTENAQLREKVAGLSEALNAANRREEGVPAAAKKAPARKAAVKS